MLAPAATLTPTWRRPDGRSARQPTGLHQRTAWLMAPRTVVVTGAGSGIGLGIATAFAELGDAVYVCDISAPRLEHAVAACGPLAHGDVVDVARYDDLEAFVGRATDRTGRLDVMVSSAGVFDGFCSVSEISVDLWQRVLDINLSGCFYAAKIAAEYMVPQRSGRIISIASISSFRGGANGVAYTAAKAGVIGLTRRVAFDVGPAGVTANAICAGAFPSEIRSNSAEVLGHPDFADRAGTPPAIRDYVIRAGRPGDVKELAATAVFLASDGAAYINGAAIAVDGGWAAT